MLLVKLVDNMTFPLEIPLLLPLLLLLFINVNDVSVSITFGQREVCFTIVVVDEPGLLVIGIIGVTGAEGGFNILGVIVLFPEDIDIDSNSSCADGR